MAIQIQFHSANANLCINDAVVGQLEIYRPFVATAEDVSRLAFISFFPYREETECIFGHKHLLEGFKMLIIGNSLPCHLAIKSLDPRFRILSNEAIFDIDRNTGRLDHKVIEAIIPNDLLSARTR